jgi:hypothetical protein
LTQSYASATHARMFRASITHILLPISLVACGGRVLDSSSDGPPGDAGTAPGPSGTRDAGADVSTSASDGAAEGPSDATAQADGSPDRDGSADSGSCIACGDGGCVDSTSDPNNCGGCGITCSGQCMGGRCLQTLASGGSPVQLAVDSQNVYFTAYNGTVNQVPVSGGAVTVLASNLGYPWGITSDASAVYFAVPNIFDGAPGWIGSVSIDGGNVTTVASNTVGGQYIAVLNGILYWDSGGYENSTSAEITSVPVGGGTLNTFVPLKTGGFYQVRGIVPRDGQVFFSEDGVGIEKQSPDALTPVPISSIPVGSLALDDSNIYVASVNGGIMAISRATAAVTTLVPGNQQQVTSSPTSIATDGVNVYWTNYYGITQSSVLRVPVTGGPPTTLASGQDDTDSVVLDSKNVYFIAGQFVRKMNKD